MENALLKIVLFAPSVTKSPRIPPAEVSEGGFVGLEPTNTARRSWVTSCRGPVEDTSRRISFMSQEPIPNRTLLMRVHTQRNSTLYGVGQPMVASNTDVQTLLTQRSENYPSSANTLNTLSAERNDSHRETDTLLLEMVRARSRDYEQAQDRTLDLPQDDVSEDQSSEPCVHGMSMRMTDRSISRRSMSRMSRVSTRRDMDIPSILAFTATVAPAPAPLENPAFQKVNSAIDQAVPRFSIRRYMCPVCSQKWKDKSSISNIKYSGLKRNSSADLPTVMAPARLRAAITREYTPRPMLASVDENKYVGFMRNSSATWQLTRARRFRTPKLQMPSPEAAAPPVCTAPMALKDFDTRVNRFLTDEGMPKYLIDTDFTYPS